MKRYNSKCNGSLILTEPSEVGWVVRYERGFWGLFSSPFFARTISMVKRE